ncbi:TITAN-like protein [Linum perenne]
MTSAVLSSRKKKSKLNPKRVGADWAEKRKVELEMQKRGEIVKSDCAANWLPNFGRVWQSGSRKESRREFEKEKQDLPKCEILPETPVTLQPYISKRMVSLSSEIALLGSSLLHIKIAFLVEKWLQLVTKSAMFQLVYLSFFL